MSIENIELLENKITTDYWNKKIRNVNQEFSNQEFLYTISGKSQVTLSGINFSEQTSNRVNELCNSNELLLFTFHLSVLSIVLSKYLGSDEIVMGSTSPKTDLDKNDLGSFIFYNTVIKPELTFKEIYKNVKDEVIDTDNYCNISADDFLNIINENNAKKIFRFGFSSAALSTELKLSDLTEIVFNLASDSRLEVQFDSGKYEPELMENLLQNYEVTLRDILQDLYKPVAEYCYVSEKEQQQQKIDFNKSNFPLFPVTTPFIQLFEEQAKLSPDAIAVNAGAVSLTYKQLNEKANTFASFLSEEKSLINAPAIAVLMERTEKIMITILAIWKCGRAYVPIDTIYPFERINSLLHESQATIVITDNANENLPFSIDKLKVINYNTVEYKAAGKAIDTQVQLSDLSYIIYTSGSTGKPKGVMIDHLGMINHIGAKINEFEITDSSVVAQNASQGFDISVWQMFAALLVGGKTFIIDNEQVFNIPFFVEEIIKNKIDILEVVPSYLQEVIGYLEKNKYEREFPDLRFLIVNAETLKHHLVQKWMDHYPAVKIVNTYGATEVSDDMSHYIMTSLPLTQTVPVMNGPIQHMRLYIVDDNLQLRPVGTKGEICIAGIGVGPGYFNDLEKTSQSFIKDHILKNNDKMYCTGDLGRFLADGTLEFLGRNDFQVKINGFRVELSEIESVIMQIQGVKDALVIAKADANNKDVLCAYFICDTPDKFDVEEIRQYLKEQLPTYMVPVSFNGLEKFPVNENGKINRKLLPEPLKNQSIKKLVKPVTPTEKKLAAIWQSVLNIEKTGIEDNFFELGGHSLLATKIVSGIQETFGIRLSIRSIFEKQTIKELGKEIDLKLATDQSPNISKIERVSRQQVHPMSSAQQRIWFFDQMGNKAGAYNIFDALSINGNIDIEIFEETMLRLIQRHEVLRTTFKVLDNQPVQRIASNLNLKIIHKEFLNKNKEERYIIIQDLMQEEASVDFDLEYGPLFRLSLIKFEEQSYVLILNMHHIITDRWSIAVFVTDFIKIYHALTNKTVPSLPELSLQYVDFSHWQKKLIDNGAFEKQLEYWQSKLDGVPQYLDLPLDFKRPQIKTYKGAKYNFSFDSELKADLEKIVVQNGASMYMVLVTFFSVLLSKYSRQNDIVIGAPIANRHYKELESMIGFFVNTLAIRVEIDEDNSFEELLSKVKTTTLEAYNNQDLPFEKLIENLKIDRNESFSPLFQVMIGMQNTPVSKDAIMGWETENIDFGSSKSKFDIEVSFEEKNENLGGFIEYSTDIFSEYTVIKLIDHFKNLIKDVITNQQKKIKEINFISTAEIAELERFNDTDSEYDEKETILSLFEARVKIEGEKEAIIFENDSISFNELNNRANKLAHFLIEQGCNPEMIVGICIERSIELVIGILAILKTGAAYLPLDPVYPIDRLIYMADDSHVKYIIIKNQHANKFSSNGRHIISIDKEKEVINEHSDSNPSIEQHGDQLFYVIYTSGSTGQPKGVEGLHRGMVNRLKWVWKEFKFKQDEVCCQKAAISFGESISEIFCPLLQGIPFVIIPDEVLKDPHLLIKVLQNKNVSRIVLVPSYLKELLNTFPDIGQLLPSLYLWTSSGEALTASVIADFKLKIPTATLLNFYGSTEISADVSFYNTDNAINSINTSIGLPIDNTKLYVLNENLQRNPIGIPGELYVGGRNVARGYYNKKHLTDERFIPNPFGNVKDVLFKTGDLVRYLPTGDLEYFGRKDNQIKIRGQRVEIGEIEATLLKHPGIKNAVIHLDINQENDNLLIAYLVVNKGHKPHMNEISKYLKECLPLYMVPFFFVELEKLPLLPNGKLDKSELLRPEILNNASGEKVGPRNDQEEKLLGIWKKMLPIGEIGIRDNFFDLGGHSLLTIRLVNQINTEFGVQIPISEIFKSSTIEKLSDYIMKYENTSKVEKSIVPIQPKGNKTPLFFIPGVGGSVIYLNDLARELGSDQPFYGLQSIGLDGISEPVRDIKSMAENYIKEIREVQPHGPYNLGGHSFGGKVAFEIAQQLLNANEKVNFLGIVEMNAPDPDYKHPDVADWDEIHWYVEIVKTVDLYYGKSRDVTYSEFTKIDKEKHIQYLKTILEEAGFLPLNSDMKQFETFLKVLKTNFQASYPPPEFFTPVNISLFLSEGNAPDGIARKVPSEYQNLQDWGWNNFSSNEVKVYVVPGNHHTVMQHPNAEILANYFNIELNR